MRVVERKEITADDFVAGLIAEFARRRYAALSIRDQHLYEASVAAFKRLEDLASDYGLVVDFFVIQDPMYGDSPVVRAAIAEAVQMNLVSLDNPTFRDMRIRLGEEEALHLLDQLPGGPELYRQLGDAFLENFDNLSHGHRVA